MKTKELILKAREERLLNIQRLFDKALICVKANIPGNDKQIRIAYILIRIFKNIIIKQIKVFDILYFDSYDGPYYLLRVDNNLSLKKQLIDIEETHPLGRFIDLDFFSANDKSVYRNELNLPPRKCYLCNKYAIMCIRNQSHSVSELLAFINKEVEKYLDQYVGEIIDFAIMKELNLDYKFGLVTPSTSGSHIDMNYQIMVKAKDAIIPGLKRMFWVGYQNQDLTYCFKTAKKIGIDTEEAMFDQTQNINAYKGLIFILGLAVCSAGYTLCNNQPLEALFDNIKIMAQNVFDDMHYNTFGEKAYRQYKFGGAREEAYLGLINVKKAWEKLDSLTDENLHMTLIEIIKNANDSVMLKRAGTLEKYLFYKEKIASIRNYDLELIKQITNECIANNISCGGAADILIAAIFISQFANLFMK